MLMKRKSDEILLSFWTGKSEDVFVCNVLIDRIETITETMTISSDSNRVCFG